MEEAKKFLAYLEEIKKQGKPEDKDAGEEKKKLFEESKEDIEF